MTAPDIPRVLRAWRAAGAHVNFGEPADEALVARAQSGLGFPLPQEVQDLWAAADGMSLASGDLVLHPLVGPEHRGVTTASRQLREWDWPVPEELLVLGDNGAEEVIGVWVVPEARRTLVVMMGSPSGEPDLAVLGTSLGGFLAAWSAFFLPLGDPGADPAIADCLAELGAPAPLTSPDDEEHFLRLLAWASPDLPDPRPDPYERPLSPAELSRLAQQP
ncbi:SMI1/KNR4 family protein [Georgenia satyanarayanai]|uniref:SMI1/KNR4 family protein n=1 Tax=Georgenia satyanarayanai TaxID=860221 RepID=UPI0020406EF8|nr:SMI1/KNR4 family protein [Georgenia satyanarayanai]MCM3659578.1 SMI1/KNR4 family protein [Georgenia satyanarayanai]